MVINRFSFQDLVLVNMETSGKVSVLRCRKCRKCVVDASCLLTIDAVDNVATECRVWHMDFDNLPAWILTSIHQARWTSGRLSCQHCRARLGGFNFVNQAKCPCGLDLTVHLCKSRLDVDCRRPGPPGAGESAAPCARPLEPLLRRLGGPSPSGCHGEAGDHARPGSVYSEEATAFADQHGRGEETEEGAEQTAPLRSLQLDRAVVTHVASPRLSKRERNRLKSQRRKQRRRERWIQSRLQEHTQGLMGNVTSSEDEDAAAAVADRESLTCAVCLDIFFSPYMCQPCGHVFCEPCLRTLAKNRAASTPCPLCRTLITHVLFQKELCHTMKTFFPKLYLSRKQNFQKSGCSRWPLPSTRKLFHIFGGFRRQPSPAGRRLFPHGGYGLGVLDTANSRGWRVEGVVLVYIRSINWLIGLSVCFFLCFLLFSSF
ncbi:hypothetical protein ANANG_G00265400 [Anguilla anguilla]|uniref:E3 ubiquitin-protein ligase RNF180 n=1 Tax=Anguilla anguilla TaxID=7936 RepID=A0A9D3LU43_ANGAN|nr:hypothetical protein ANANG_G00265400 [Anguilla anguilla]